MTDFTLTPERVCEVAKSGITVLNDENTSIRGNLRADIHILEAILLAMSRGDLIVGVPPKKVESEGQVPKPPEDPSNG